MNTPKNSKTRSFNPPIHRRPIFKELPKNIDTIKKELFPEKIHNTGGSRGLWSANGPPKNTYR